MHGHLSVLSQAAGMLCSAMLDDPPLLMIARLRMPDMLVLGSLYSQKMYFTLNLDGIRLCFYAVVVEDLHHDPSQLAFDKIIWSVLRMCIIIHSKLPDLGFTTERSLEFKPRVICSNQEYCASHIQ